MKFDKKIKDMGIWCDKASVFDDYAYYLYLKYIAKNYYIVPDFQNDVIEFHNMNSVYFSEFYKEAKNILRKEKIIKLKMNINGV